MRTMLSGVQSKEGGFRIHQTRKSIGTLFHDSCGGTRAILTVVSQNLHKRADLLKEKLTTIKKKIWGSRLTRVGFLYGVGC